MKMQHCEHGYGSIALESRERWVAAVVDAPLLVTDEVRACRKTSPVLVSTNMDFRRSGLRSVYLVDEECRLEWPGKLLGSRAVGS